MREPNQSGTMAAVSAPPQAPAFRLEAAGVTDIGTGRQHNEDAVLLRPDLQLYLLADGAGGHNAGNVASALATTAIAHYFESRGRAPEGAPSFDAFGLAPEARALARAIQQANKEILEISKTSERHQGMGTTVVAALFAVKAGLLHLGHLGDSRCYRLRNGHIEQLTHDHSLLNDVLEMRPDLDDAVLARLPRNVVTRALGMSDAVRPSVQTYDVLPGDRYLLCSDGLTERIEIDEIGEALMLPMTPDEHAHLFIAMANERHAGDNIAAVVIDCPPSGDGKGKARPAVRRRGPGVRAQPPTPVIEASNPEIVLMPTENDRYDAEDPTGGIRFVPAESASPDIREALTGLVPKHGQGPQGAPKPKG
jgi:protein phosphatase